MQAARTSTRLNSSHTEIYTLTLHDAPPISSNKVHRLNFRNMTTSLFMVRRECAAEPCVCPANASSSDEHTPELQSHRDLHSYPTRRSSDLKSQSAQTEFPKHDNLLVYGPA